MNLKSLSVCGSFGVALLMAHSAAYAQPGQDLDIQYVLTPVTDRIGDILTGTITTDGKLGVLQGSDIVGFQFTYNLSPALTSDDGIASVDTGTWGSSDAGTFVVAALEDTPTGIDASKGALTFVGGGSLLFVQDTSATHAFSSFTDGMQGFGDKQGLEQTFTTLHPAPYVVATAPEIDPASAAGGLTLLLSGLAVLRGRKRTY